MSSSEFLPSWTEQRETVFLDRYSHKDEFGQPTEKSPPDMFRRVARAVAEPEDPLVRQRYEEEFFRMMSEWEFLPGGRVLAGAGTHHAVTYFNCYVIPVRSKDPTQGNDSRQGIMDTIAAAMEILSRGGGVGINWSTLRPRGCYVKGVNGTSSGSVSWMIACNEVAHQVQQGGSRRGAQMYMLWDWHPDIEEFISVKSDRTKLEHANLSVAISDRFMGAVKHDLDWSLEFPDTADPDYNSIWDGDLEEWKALGKPTKVYKTLKARELWQKIAYCAWENGEPGVVFLDRYNKMNNLKYTEKIISVNPCGEQGLPGYGVCNLGAINLVAFYRGGSLDFARLKEVVHLAVRFLDNVVDLNRYFIPEMEQHEKNGVRRIGLGTMGLADLLILMKLRYGSSESLAFIESIYRLIRDEAYRASVELAKERGPFPYFRAAEYLAAPFVQALPEDITTAIREHGIRNGVLLTQAPTGTTSILTGVSSGIEPNFAFQYIRKDRTGTYTVHHWLAQLQRDSQPSGKLPDYFVTAHDLTPEEHIRMQALIQRYVDSSISKTVNAPKTHTVEDVQALYELAYDLGCKGVTYFRDGSREGVLQHTDSSKAEKVGPKKRPRRLLGMTEVIETPVGRAYVTINQLNGRPFEFFANIGKAGSDLMAFTEALARLISLALRSGIDIREVVSQLEGIGGATTTGFGPERVFSVPDAFGKFLRRVAEENGEVFEAVERYDICPACGQSSLVIGEGCKTCINCGYSLC